MKTYYIADFEYSSSIYGSQYPVCIDLAEVERLAKEWSLSTEELLEQMHEADEKEIAEFGTYDHEN